MQKFPNANIVNVKPRNHNLLYFAGLIAMVLNKMRRLNKSYSSPRPFKLSDIRRNINYVLNVVDNWEKIAKIYTGKEAPFLNASILELGPGPDLGTGLILLSMGAKSYHAIDMFPLATNTPSEFYDSLFDAIATKPYSKNAYKIFKDFSQKLYPDNFQYQQVQYPTLRELRENQFDIIISQAVWEHISNPETTLLNLIRSANKGAVFINEIDLASHTRFIKDIDPLNLLRFENTIYNSLSFPGAPNRLRASDYYHFSNKLGLEKIHLAPIRTVSDECIKSLQPTLPSVFQKKEYQDLATLSCWWLATFPG